MPRGRRRRGSTSRQGRDAQTAVLVGPPPPHAYAFRLQVTLGDLVRDPRPVFDLLLGAPVRAARMLSRAATAAAADLVGVPPRGYGDPLRASRLQFRIINLVQPLARAALQLLPAAACTVADMVGVPPHAYAAVLQVSLVLVLRVRRSSLGRALMMTPARALLILGDAAIRAAHSVGLPPPAPVRGAQLRLQLRLGLLVLALGRAMVMCLGAAASILADMVGLPPLWYAAALQVPMVLLCIRRSCFGRLFLTLPRAALMIVGVTATAAAAILLVAPASPSQRRFETAGG